MAKILQTESSLTDRYQTTVPDIVRKTLGLKKRDKISYTINDDGTVTIARREASEEDPILGKFLDFIAQDMDRSPQNIQPINKDTFDRVQSLVKGMETDLDVSLSDEDE